MLKSLFACVFARQDELLQISDQRRRIPVGARPDGRNEIADARCSTAVGARPDGRYFGYRDLKVSGFRSWRASNL